MNARAVRCNCGRMPGLRSRILDGDSVSTWVECPGCRRAGAEAIDSARDDGAAIAHWNDGKGRNW
ncbi:hypothetical protein C100_14940 [Sphingobium sp. C100]|uniref:hypothetical protein n=1 Tax=Sphingobium sp. C100 TaxID=1207055 RepID=UPI0003D65505|nr:hypothetical protein [Sphingobium sp. C100]ETI63005.1 hypothetical protein C100_14940 [Sphingobium sp. C100]